MFVISYTGYLNAACRLDLQRTHCRDIMHPYSMSEARSAFSCLLKHHQAHGWDDTPPTEEHQHSWLDRPSTHRGLVSNSSAASTSQDAAANSHQLQLPPANSDAFWQRHHHTSRASVLPPDQANTASTSSAHQQQLAPDHHKAVSQIAAHQDAIQSNCTLGTVQPQAATAGQHATTSAAIGATAAAAGTKSGAEAYDADYAAKQTANRPQAVLHTADIPPVDLTFSPVSAAVQKQQPGGTATAAAEEAEPILQDPADQAEDMQEAADQLPAVSTSPMVEGVVDLLSPAGTQAQPAKHSGDDVLPDVEAKRRRLAPQV